MLNLNIFDKAIKTIFLFFFVFTYKSKIFFNINNNNDYSSELLDKKNFLLELQSKYSLLSFFRKNLFSILVYYYSLKRTFSNNISFFFKKNYNANKKNMVLNFLYTACSSIFKFFSVSIILAISYIYILSVYHVTPFLKLIFGWLVLVFFAYLLVSGFVFFVKKLSFSKYTDALQRFWKRSFSIFWLIEGGLFLVFIYFSLNSSSEIFYGYDSQVLLKSHLGSLRVFFFKLCLINLMLVLSNYLLILSQSNNEDTMFSVYLLISVIIVYVTWLEFYQFYIFLQSVGYYSWLFSLDSYEFSLDPELRRSRTANNYVLICSIAKFWHFVFIVFVWFFYLNRYLESSTSRVTLIGTSIQNFVILYVLNLISIYPYLKFLFRKYLNISYKWFFVDFNYASIKVVLSFATNFYYSLI